MTVNDIVKEWLITNGYEGLYNGSEYCGCDIEDLNACGGPMGGCQPAYKHLSGEGDNVHCGVKEITDIEDGHCIECEMGCQGGEE